MSLPTTPVKINNSKIRYPACEFRNARRENILEPSSGGIGKRLNIARLIFRVIREIRMADRR